MARLLRAVEPHRVPVFAAIAYTKGKNVSVVVSETRSRKCQERKGGNKVKSELKLGFQGSIRGEEARTFERGNCWRSCGKGPVSTYFLIGVVCISVRVPSFEAGGILDINNQQWSTAVLPP